MMTLPESGPPRAEPVVFHVDRALLCGSVAIPAGAQGLVVFARASGMSRLTTRNHGLAFALNRVGFGTLLLDLLSLQEECEEADGAMRRFDVDLLSDRLSSCAELLRRSTISRGLPFGYFGVGTAAAACLVGAVDTPGRVGAIVSQAGRPDLVERAMLARLTTPTLLLVGDAASRLLTVNRAGLQQLGGERQLHVVAGATHAFAEPGAMDEVASCAADWFRRHLAQQQTREAQRRTAS